MEPAEEVEGGCLRASGRHGSTCGEAAEQTKGSGWPELHRRRAISRVWTHLRRRLHEQSRRLQAGGRGSVLGVYPGHRAEPLQWLGCPVVRRSEEAAVAHGALPNNGGAAVVLGLVAALAWRGRVQEGARGQLKAEAGSGRACPGLEQGSRR